MQDRRASFKEKKEVCSAQEVGVNVKLEEQNPLQRNVQNVGSSYTLPDEPRLLQMINIIQLPKAELMTFSGDPLDFWVFMHSFDNSIGSAAVDDSTKLNRLFQYCKGEALKVIKCSAVTSPSEGYARARVLLKERFGDDYKISKMWVRKVTEGPVIRYSEGRCLQEMADDLRSCKETLGAMNKLEEIDTRRSMVKIVERLPQPLQSPWRRLVVKSLETSNRYPSIAELVCFVSEAAREVTDPVFGVSENKVRKPERGRGASFGVQADESQQGPGRCGRGSDSKVKDTKIKHDVCRLCRGGHDLSACFRFKAMSPGEKLSFVWGKKVRFCCFDGRHVASQCRAGVVSGVEGCIAKHSKCCTNPLYVLLRRTLENIRRLLIQELAVTTLRALPTHAAHQDKDRPN